MFDMKNKKSKINEPMILISLKDIDINVILDKVLKTKQKEFKCHYCKDKTSRTSLGGVMPSDTSEPIYLCQSIICMIEYSVEHLIELDDSDSEYKGNASNVERRKVNWMINIPLNLTVKILNGY